MPVWRKASLCLVRSLVPPAREKYSPPDREVGMVMSGIVGGWTGRAGELASTEYRPSSLGVVMLFARDCGRGGWGISRRRGANGKMGRG